MGTTVTTYLEVRYSTTGTAKMSGGSKISDVMKAFQQNKINKALGVTASNSRFGNQSSRQPYDYNNSNVPTTTSNAASTSTPSNPSTTSTSWNMTNVAREEPGTTFYSQVKQNAMK